MSDQLPPPDSRSSVTTPGPRAAWSCPAFVSRDNKKFYDGERVRGFLIEGPQLVEGERIPPTDSYRLVVLDGKISFNPGLGCYRFSPDDPALLPRMLPEFNLLVAL